MKQETINGVQGTCVHMLRALTRRTEAAVHFVVLTQ